MIARTGLVAVLAGLVFVSGAVAPGRAEPVCPASRVHYTPYPGGAPGLGGLPWIAGAPAKQGLVGLLWYWPRTWRAQHVRAARIYLHGRAPRGASTKILWAFLSPAAKRAFRGGDLVVTGKRLDGAGATRGRFVEVSYAGQDGAPSFASIVSVPSKGCWRLHLAAGGLSASVVVDAVPR